MVSSKIQRRKKSLMLNEMNIIEQPKLEKIKSGRTKLESKILKY